MPQQHGFREEGHPLRGHELNPSTAVLAESVWKHTVIVIDSQPNMKKIHDFGNQ